MIKKTIKALAKAAGIRISKVIKGYDEDGLFTIHNDEFRSRPDFRAAYGRALKTITSSADAKTSAMVESWNGEFVPGIFGQWRIHIALWCASTAVKLEGDFVECGVFVGFTSSAIMKHLDWNARSKKFYLIDTFAGPDVEQFNEDELRRGRKTEIETLKQAGAYKYDFDTVQRNFKEWPNAKLIKGLVPDILSECPARKVAYLHLDMNCVLPETSAIRFFWDKLVPGGIILLDDYAFCGYEEQHNAMNALSKEMCFEIASLPTGQGLIVKTP